MKSKILLVFISIAVILGLALGFMQHWTISRQPHVTDVVDRGIRYLAAAYTPYHYPDPYLAYVYPGEVLTCPITGCHITYRILDAFFDVSFISSEVRTAASLGIQRDDAAETLKAILPEWRSANFSNTILGAGKNGLALDTGCILGYVERDTAMADHVASFLTPDGNWMRDDYYTEDVWRNIADESWCIRLFAVTGRQTDKISGLVETKIKETNAFLATQTSMQDRIAVLYHMIFLLADVNDARNIAELQRYRALLADAAQDTGIVQDTFTEANILEALSRVKGTDAALLTRLADTIVSRQGSDGSWTRTSGSNDYPVFTTFRAVLALNQYEKSLETE